MKNNEKQAKYRTLWLFLSVMDKMKVKESVGVDPNTAPSSDTSQSELQLLALELLPEGKIVLKRQIASL